MTYEVSADNPLNNIYERIHLTRLILEEMHEQMKIMHDKMTLLEHDNRYLRAKVAVLEEEYSRVFAVDAP